jgi:predicted DNA-binding transcriptional regulator AlpA
MEEQAKARKRQITRKGEFQEKLVRVPDTANRLAVAEVTVRRMIRDGQLDVVRLGPKGWAVRVTESSIERMIQAGMVPAGAR